MPSVELDGRDIHRRLKGGLPGVGPLLDLSAGGLQHPITELHDETALLRQRDEGAGRDDPSLGMKPTATSARASWSASS